MHGHHHRRFRGMTAEAMRAAADAMESGEAPGRATTRVQLELPPQAMERLQRLKDRTEAASYAEVIRNALRLYEALADEHEKGAEFSLTRPDGSTMAYRIFVG